MADSIASEIGTSIITVISAIIGVAIIAVLVSSHAATTSVLTAGGNAFAKVLSTALSPVGSSNLSGVGSNLLAM